MGKYSIGEFEEIVLLTIMILEDEAYGVTIKQHIENNMDRTVSLGAMRTALDRMEEKGYVDSQFGEATAVRGGKRKKFFAVTRNGVKVLQTVKAAREKLWEAVPEVAYKFNFIVS